MNFTVHRCHWFQIMVHVQYFRVVAVDNSNTHITILFPSSIYVYHVHLIVNFQEEKLGFSSSQMATMYSRGILPPGVDPASFEAIAYCKYIRTYSPPENEDKTILAGHRHSSWK